ncbi:probable cyclin-dependent serine/threonine-protein kinase DDB_G0292550 isoform X2 [Daktulosphaira vitifoliae]|uniref:probable cyclin-dependent serine/threonine-protein kinase DDB_G0292550 isoform X2 n=1 Tax=Daktulosphaira vitifoliae TaxID=58002 RepID=UPI0021AAF0B1|nr:probable cyclin-dependent serine/threonine-protein kinase DDB_G0292550 isoform X2 [Daktulosphaira vitifoliae]
MEVRIFDTCERSKIKRILYQESFKTFCKQKQMFAAYENNSECISKKLTGRENYDIISFNTDKTKSPKNSNSCIQSSIELHEETNKLVQSFISSSLQKKSFDSHQNDNSIRKNYWPRENSLSTINNNYSNILQNNKNTIESINLSLKSISTTKIRSYDESIEVKKTFEKELQSSQINVFTPKLITYINDKNMSYEIKNVSTRSIINDSIELIEEEIESPHRSSLIKKRRHDISLSSSITSYSTFKQNLRQCSSENNDTSSLKCFDLKNLTKYNGEKEKKNMSKEILSNRSVEMFEVTQNLKEHSYISCYTPSTINNRVREMFLETPSSSLSRNDLKKTIPHSHILKNLSKISVSKYATDNVLWRGSNSRKSKKMSTQLRYTKKKDKILSDIENSSDSQLDISLDLRKLKEQWLSITNSTSNFINDSYQISNDYNTIDLKVNATKRICTAANNFSDMSFSDSDSILKLDNSNNFIKCGQIYKSNINNLNGSNNTIECDTSNDSWNNIKKNFDWALAIESENSDCNADVSLSQQKIWRLYNTENIEEKLSDMSFSSVHSTKPSIKSQSSLVSNLEELEQIKNEFINCSLDSEVNIKNDLVKNSPNMITNALFKNFTFDVSPHLQINHNSNSNFLTNKDTSPLTGIIKMAQDIVK